ncbi:unnamed protein product [Prorocentrum cordatum]|uniref:Uncharacterized protein n=1 Tax=Prorocentrum cordatum TaxID=2364126 RepID=A0ABN9Q5M1_9DINO|nr:unnamed protein product [Polarella glacialis]
MEAIKGGKAAVEQAAEQGLDPISTKQALEQLVVWGEKASAKEAVIQATRCFFIETNESPDSDVECVKWIFAMNSHPELKAAFDIARSNGYLKAISLQLGKDEAPLSRAAKQVERLAFRKGGGGAAAGKGRKKRRKR